MFALCFNTLETLIICILLGFLQNYLAYLYFCLPWEAKRNRASDSTKHNIRWKNAICATETNT